MDLIFYRLKKYDTLISFLNLFFWVLVQELMYQLFLNQREVLPAMHAAKAIPDLYKVVVQLQRTKPGP